jgi:hypothetical protein
MAEFRFCPACGAEIGNFKFCAQCGLDLATLASESEASREPEGPAHIADSGDTHPISVVSVASAAVSGPRTTTKQGLGAAQELVAALKQRVAQTDEATADKRKLERAARTAKTVMQAQITPEQVAAAQARTKARADEKAAEAAPRPAAPGKRKRRSAEFSETQWFMKGARIIPEEVTPDGAVETADADYTLDESIPEEKRRKFTLRKDNEE